MAAYRFCVLFLALVLLSSPAAGALAGEVTAYKNPDARVVVDGQELRFADDGKRLDLLMLDGVAYAPLMQLSKALGKDVSWDQQERTFYVGLQPGGVDMIDDLKAYAVDGSVTIRTTEDDMPIEVAGRKYAKYLQGHMDTTSLYYNLEGRFSAVTFLAYADYKDKTLKAYGDNDALLYQAEIGAYDLPTAHTIDVRGCSSWCSRSRATPRSLRCCPRLRLRKTRLGPTGGYPGPLVKR